jgi:hypothetical protein
MLKMVLRKRDFCFELECWSSSFPLPAVQRFKPVKGIIHSSQTALDRLEVQGKQGIVSKYKKQSRAPPWNLVSLP